MLDMYKHYEEVAERHADEWYYYFKYFWLFLLFLLMLYGFGIIGFSFFFFSSLLLSFLILLILFVMVFYTIKTIKQFTRYSHITGVGNSSIARNILYLLSILFVPFISVATTYRDVFSIITMLCCNITLTALFSYNLYQLYSVVEKMSELFDVNTANNMLLPQALKYYKDAIFKVTGMVIAVETISITIPIICFYYNVLSTEIFASGVMSFVIGKYAVLQRLKNERSFIEHADRINEYEEPN